MLGTLHKRRILGKPETGVRVLNLVEFTGEVLGLSHCHLPNISVAKEFKYSVILVEGAVFLFHHGFNLSRDPQQVRWMSVYSLDREKVVMNLGYCGYTVFLFLVNVVYR